VELGKDHVVAGAARATQDAEDFHLHRLGLAAAKDGPGGSGEAGVDLAQGEKTAANGRGGLARAGKGEAGRAERKKKRGQPKPGLLKAGFHVYKINADTCGGAGWLRFASQRDCFPTHSAKNAEWMGHPIAEQLTNVVFHPSAQNAEGRSTKSVY
jgi:hypothetical protein